jgi:hypothetical protein
MQQGVPLLDTDWNELEDLRRHEMATALQRYIGDGVPGDNDGFLVSAFEDGGVGTIVLEATASGSGRSTIAIDRGASTAASVFDFPRGTFAGGPARLPSTSAGPFSLAEGMTLTVVVNEESGETVTFSAADFSDIAAATAAEVVGVLNSSLLRAQATAGAGNDFLIRGGDGTTEGAGRLLVRGREALNEGDTAYTSQQLYQNNTLATAWGVPPVEALTAPETDDRVDVVYVDVWDREVGSDEDEAFLLPAVGIETTVRLRREWAVRVAEDATDLSGISRLPGHVYLPLARLERAVADAEALPVANVIDLRQRQLTLADVAVSPLLVRDEFGLDWVNPSLFEQMLRTMRDVYGDLLESDLFLASNFADVTVVESSIMLRVFQDVRFLAEVGITDVARRRMDNDAALAFMRRLYEGQQALVETVSDFPDNGSVGRVEALNVIEELRTWLEGNDADIPGLRDHVLPGESPDLGRAYDAQIFINSELGRRVGVLPRGLVDIQFDSGPTGVIAPGTVHAFRYTVESMLNVDDTLALSLTDTEGEFGFAFEGLDEDPAHPGDASHALLTLAPDDPPVPVPFDLLVPSSASGGTTSRIVLTATSQVNPDEVSFANVEILVEVGATLELPSTEVELTLESPPINLATDVVDVGTVSEGGDITFMVQASNNAGAAQEFQLSVAFVGQPNSYEVVSPSLPALATIDAGDSEDVSIVVQATTDATEDEGESLMVIRLARTADSAFQELHVRVHPDVAT